MFRLRTLKQESSRIRIFCPPTTVLHYLNILILNLSNSLKSIIDNQIIPSTRIFCHLERVKDYRACAAVPRGEPRPVTLEGGIRGVDKG